MDRSEMRYKVSHCRSDASLFGPIHGACDVNGSSCYETLCGCRISDRWWILKDTDESEITCVICLQVIQERQAALLEQAKQAARYLFHCLDLVETTDDGREFHPNYISSCRVQDSAKMNTALKVLKQWADPALLSNRVIY